MTKDELYKEAVDILPLLELVVKDKDQYKLIRKRILDLANDIKRSDTDGIQT